MIDIINKILDIIYKEYEIYTEIYFNEQDKCFLLFINDLEHFNLLNENTKKFINKINTLEKEKDELIKKISNELNILDKKIDIYFIIKNYFPEKLDEFESLRSKFAIVLKNSKIVNNKLIILLNSGASFIKAVYDSITENSNSPMYNKNGNINKFEYNRFQRIL